MEGPGDYLNKWSQRKTNIVWYHLYAESKKKLIQMNLFTKQKQMHRLRKWICDYQRGKVGNGLIGNWGLTVIFKTDNQQGPTQ